MQIGDRVLVLHESGDPFYDGKVSAFSKCGGFAKVKDADWNKWYRIDRIRLLPENFKVAPPKESFLSRMFAWLDGARA